MQKLDSIAKESEESKKAGEVWVIIDSTLKLLKDFKELKHVLLAETADAETLEPHMLVKAKCHLN